MPAAPKKHFPLFLVLLLLAAGCNTGSSISDNLQNNNQLINSTTMQITSSQFENNQIIPAKYTCKGAGVNPSLNFSGVPAAAKSLVLILEDPDAPGGTYYHWLMWNINPNISNIEENSVPSGAVQGKNSAGQNAYMGPCPPSGTHRYFFKAFALDIKPNLGTVDDYQNLVKAMQGHILKQAELMGTVSN